MSNVVIECEPKLNIYESLNEKLLELRAKRDAILLSHKMLKKKSDFYNKCIIYLSLIAACFETVKAQLKLAERNDIIADMSILAPIFLTTAVTIISSLLKFKKFPEKMESNTKAAEKCYFAIIRIRQLIENLNFQDEVVSKTAYNTEVMVYYRDALDSIERTMYPKQRTALFLQAQQNLMTIQKNEYNYNHDAHKVKTRMVDLEEKKLELTKRERGLYDEEQMLEALSNASTPSNFSVHVPKKKSNSRGCFGGGDIETGGGGGDEDEDEDEDGDKHGDEDGDEDDISDDDNVNDILSPNIGDAVDLSKQIMQTAAQPNRDSAPTEGINAALGDAFNTTGVSNLTNSQKKRAKRLRQKANKKAAATLIDASQNTIIP